MHRDLDVTRKTAWHLSMRIRETVEDEGIDFSGPVEVTERGGNGEGQTRAPGSHPNQVSAWEQRAVEGMTEVFSRGRSGRAETTRRRARTCTRRPGS